LPKTQNDQDNETRTRPIYRYPVSCYSIAVIVIKYGMQRVF
jgi:hypothetical protein